MHCSALRGHIRPSVTRRVNIQYMGFHLRNSFQERIACLAIFQIYRSFICLMKHIRFMLFKKAKTGFLKIDHAVSVKLYFLEPIFRNCTGKNSIPFWTFRSSLGSNQTVLWTQSFSLNSLFTASLSRMFIRFFHNTYLYAFAIPFSYPKSQPLLLRKCDFILSQQTQPNNATPARYCCGFPSIGLHPFLIHTLIRKVRDTLQDLPFPTAWKGFFQSFPPSESLSSKDFPRAFLSRTFKSVSLEPISFLPNPFVQLSGSFSSLFLRFVLSLSAFFFWFPFPPRENVLPKRISKPNKRKNKFWFRKRTVVKLFQPSFFLWAPASF